MAEEHGQQRALAWVGVPDDEPALAELAAALVEHRLQLTGPLRDLHDVQQGRDVIVVISDASLASVPFRETVAELERRAAQLLPLSLITGAVDLLPDLSHIRLPIYGPQRAARRIAIVAEAGIADIAAWNRLSLRATQWNDDGRRYADLLSARELDEATALLVRPIASLAGEARKVLQQMVLRSRARLRRRRMIVSGVAMLATSVLAGTSVLAFAQRINAQASEVVARRSASAAQADRLLGSASSLIDIDPDLPWVLAREAVRSDPSDDVVAEAGAIVGDLVPHVTFDLPSAPIRLVGSGTTRIAMLVVGERRIEVVDVADGSQKGGFDRGTAIRGFALAPDATRLALLVDDRLEVVDLQGTVLTKGPAAGGVVVWDRPDRVLLLSQDTISSFDPGTGALRHVAGIPGARVLTSVPKEGLIVVGTADAVLLFDDAGAPLGGRPLPGLSDVVAGPAGSEVLAQTASTVVRLPIDLLKRAATPGDEPDEIQTTAREIAPSGRWPVPSCRSDGSIGAINDGATVVSGTLPAHRGACTGVVVLPDGRWASVGGDARLRRWDPTSLTETYLQNRALHPRELLLDPGGANLESTRNLIVAEGGTDRATVVASPSFGAAVVSRKDPSHETTFPVGVLDSLVRPAATAGRGARFAHDGRVLVWDGLAKTAKLLAAPPSVPAQTAVSPSGRFVAVAWDVGAAVIDAMQPEPAWTSFEFAGDRPVSLDVTDEGEATVLSATGMAHRRDGSRRIGLPAARHDIVAGRASTGSVVLVDRSGDLLCGDTQRVERCGSVDVTIEPGAVDVAGDLAAVVGRVGTEVVSLRTGRTIRRIRAGSAYRAVNGVAFDEDGRGAVVVRGDGSIARVSFVAAEQVRNVVEAGVPRTLTAEEREIFDTGQTDG